MDYQLTDVDQHYYEPQDALTRYLDPKYRRAVQWCEMRGRQHLLLGEKIVHAGVAPEHKLTPLPGRLSTYFKGGNPEGKSVRELIGEPEPCRPEYVNRELRLAKLDEQGVETAVILPQVGLVVEEALHEDPGALYAVLDAYQRWLDDDWGLARDNRIICPAVVSLVDPARAEQQLAWLIDHGAKLIVFRPGPVVGPNGSTSPADPIYDRFWSMAEEAGVVAAFHVADANAKKYAQEWSNQKGLNYDGLFEKALPGSPWVMV